MANLPPLANFIAVSDENPAALADVEHALRTQPGPRLCPTEGPYTEVFRPHPRWVVGLRLMPDSLPDPPAARQAGLVFAEGRRTLERGHAADLSGRFKAIAELVRTAPQRLQQLPGDFSFLHFTETGRITAVRSVAGTAPVYLYQRPGRTVLATQFGSVIEIGGAPIDYDYLVCGIWSLGYPMLPDGRTHLKNIRLLPRGSFSVVIPAQAGIQNAVEPLDARFRGHDGTSPYWTPPTSPTRPPPESIQLERAQEFKRLLIGYLDENLHPDGGNLLSLSGGVDSGSLYALCAGHLKREVFTWTGTMPPGPSRDREMPYICSLIERYQPRHAWMVPLTPEVLSRPRPQPYTRFPANGDILAALPWLKEKWGVRTIQYGLFADELCGSPKTPPDWCLSVNLLDVARSLAQGHSDYKEPLRWLKHRLLWAAGRPLLPLPREMPGILLPALRKEYAQWLKAQRRRTTAGSPRNYYMLASLNWFEGYLVSTWEACSAQGIRRVSPFIYREALDFACATHPAEKIRPLTKKVLRRALDGLVPGRTLYRPDKGIPLDIISKIPVPDVTPQAQLSKNILLPDQVPSPIEKQYGLHLVPAICERLEKTLSAA